MFDHAGKCKAVVVNVTHDYVMYFYNKFSHYKEVDRKSYKRWYYRGATVTMLYNQQQVGGLLFSVEKGLW